MFTTTPLHAGFGLQIHGIQLKDVTASYGYPEIRAAFEDHSLLLFSGQNIDDAAHLKFGLLFGPREDRTIDPADPDPSISLVSNLKPDQTLYVEGEQKLLDLQSNMLWHTDSTFLPVPALANILIGRTIPPSGSVTEFASSRLAWEAMPAALKARVRDACFIHDYSHSRRKIDPGLAELERFTHWEQQVWKSVWTNPVNHREALYIASHACDVVGMSRGEAQGMIDQLLDWCTQPHFVYSHQWQPDDVLVWDERALLHRGRPWNYDEPRCLSSICISATPADGLDTMRCPDLTEH